jgi:hypothetical protein
LVKGRTLWLLLAIPLYGQAQVYRWVDEKGKVHYGDRPVAKEVLRVPGLIEPTKPGLIPKPGMKADEVRAAYGEPTRVQNLTTKSGSVLVWTYQKSTRVKQDFVARIEGGEVTEVSTDSWLGDAGATTNRGTPAATRAASEAAAQDYQEQQAAGVVADKERRCASLRESVQNIESRERRGGSAASMDSLREQKRRTGEQMWSQGCGS